MPQTWRLALRHWPGRKPGVGYVEAGWAEYYQWDHIEIPKPPLVSITTFTYADTLGNTADMTQGFTNTVGNYLLDLETEPGRIVLPFAGIWPTTILLPGSAILITYKCGYPAWTGTLDVDADGIATWKTGDKFDARLTGTWLTLSGMIGSPLSRLSSSFDVLTVTDDQHLQLVVQPNADISFPETGLTFTGNAVPMPIRHAILYRVAKSYNIREDTLTGAREAAIEVPDTVAALLSDYRV